MKFNWNSNKNYIDTTKNNNKVIKNVQLKLKIYVRNIKK